MNLENEAYRAAVRWHGDQMYGDKPYEFHLQAVRDTLVEFGVIQDYMLACAWLHDTLEDTDYPVREMAKGFGPEITQIVFCVSGFGRNRAERAQDLYYKLDMFETRDPYILKAADRISNMRQSIGTPMAEMYRKEHNLFMDVMGDNIGLAMIDELNRLARK